MSMKNQGRNDGQPAVRKNSSVVTGGRTDGKSPNSPIRQEIGNHEPRDPKMQQIQAVDDTDEDVKPHDTVHGENLLSSKSIENSEIKN